MSIVLAIAPHPDDETLGCGGALLRHKAEGDIIHWLIVTDMTEAAGFSASAMKTREREIATVAKAYGFASVTRLGFPATRLDTLPTADIVAAIGKALNNIQPEVVYVPFSGDVHSDHRITFGAVAACGKWFRYPSIKRLIACEIPSETDFGLDPGRQPFRPNLFVDVAKWLDDKIRIMESFKGEMDAFPFPRSAEAIRALARHRGSQCGSDAAEAFMLLKETR